MDTVNSPLIRNHLLFGNKKKSVTFTSFFNKGYKYCKMNKIINREEDNFEIYEGYSQEDIIDEEEDIENDSENKIKIEKNESKKEEKKQQEDKKEIETEPNKKYKKPVKHIYQIHDTYTKNTKLNSSDTIYYIHTTPLQTLNFTPQKMLSLCDEIMK